MLPYYDEPDEDKKKFDPMSMFKMRQALKESAERLNPGKKKKGPTYTKGRKLLAHEARFEWKEISMKETLKKARLKKKP